MKNDDPSNEQAVLRHRLAEMVDDHGDALDGNDPAWAIAATELRRKHWQEREREAAGVDFQGDNAVGSARHLASKRRAEFLPDAPSSLKDVGVGESLIESLVLKFLLNRCAISGREITAQIKLPFQLVTELLRRLKAEQLIVYKGAAPMGDYVHELTDSGFDRAQRYSKQSSYFGAVPVPLSDYIASVGAQSIRKQHPKLPQLRKAFGNLVLSEEMLSQLGQAVASGLGMFLYGASGNGKTSIAVRLTGTFGEGIWIPRAICVMGEIIRLYDPNNHEALDTPEADEQPGEPAFDHRWIRIRRPTIVVGGELTMEHLEVTTNPVTGVSEAPLQLKSNGGTLVIDDFGRQRITPVELLNRWIVPLEERHDYLNLASGRKIKVPFDQLIVFSTNLEPRELVDEAFLRRIPYKIDVKDPSIDEFCELFRRVANTMGVEYQRQSVDYLLEKHYRAAGRSMRFCHARDLLHQVRVYCTFHDRPLALTNETVDAAVKNYFAMI